MDEKEKSNENSAPEVEVEEVKQNSNNSVDDSEMTKKVIFSLCYLWGILFFIPLILYKDDAKAMRHANEGLVLLLFSAVGNIVFGILSSITWIFSLIAAIYSFAILILGIIGILYIITDMILESKKLMNMTLIWLNGKANSTIG